MTTKTLTLKLTEEQLYALTLMIENGYLKMRETNLEINVNDERRPEIARGQKFITAVDEAEKIATQEIDRISSAGP